ncbi:hypothetical protein EVA_10772 [gut metagenome]|uniref:Uncharacterized protein n=1 Tax=gut metagenome TaxID=749906 RepID=J9GH16_9ZZZZ
MLIILIHLQLFFNGISNTFLHLSCCCPGKGYNQKPINIHRILFIQNPT